MEVSSQEETLIEEREEQMISPSGGKPSWRIAHFLKPSLNSSKQPHNLQTLFKPITPNLKSLSSKVNFHGWKCPMKDWGSWVKKLKPSFQSTWEKTSIYEPLMASTIEIPRCHDSIFALADRWCPETNSFVFPWGECSITLEDVMVLGGYPVTGDSVLSELSSKELCEIDEELIVARWKTLRCKSKKATQQHWMDIWMGKGSEIEHEAFLSLWLSRCVFPADDASTINKRVFPIAVLLAKGTKIALAPAVLASIYRDLRLLKEKIATLGDQIDGNVEKLNLWAPLQVLQVWVWERFPTLSPNPNPMSNRLPRLARWNKLKILRKDDVGLAMDSAKDGFRWRPYSTPLNNWLSCPKLYPEKESWVLVGYDVDLDLQSYARCIRVSELVGLDCDEQYLPHRVSMQFGLDQDIPMDAPRLNGDYNRPIKDIKLYMPSRLFESDVTTRYLQWWKKSNFGEEKDEKTGFNCFQDTPKRSMEVVDTIRIKLENNEADVPPGFASKCKGMEDDSDCDQLTLTELFKLNRPETGNKNGVLSHSESPLSSAGENVFIQELKSPINYNEFSRPSEGTRRVPIVEDEIESKVGSSTKKKEVGTSCHGTPECAGLDLVGRIARLRRIVDMVKAVQACQP